MKLPCFQNNNNTENRLYWGRESRNSSNCMGRSGLGPSTQRRSKDHKAALGAPQGGSLSFQRVREMQERFRQFYLDNHRSLSGANQILASAYCVKRASVTTAILNSRS